jgi:hypothetical protein
MVNADRGIVTYKDTMPKNTTLSPPKKIVVGYERTKDAVIFSIDCGEHFPLGARADIGHKCIKLLALQTPPDPNRVEDVALIADTLTIPHQVLRLRRKPCTRHTIEGRLHHQRSDVSFAGEVHGLPYYKIVIDDRELFRQ